MIMASNNARSVYLKRWLLSSAIAVALVAACMMMFGTATLKADCGPPAKHLMGSVFHPAAFITMAPEEGHESDRDHASFVGFWHVKLYQSDGSLFFQSTVIYHSDGTEFESAYIPSITGDFCDGIWKKVNDHTVKIYHVVLAHDVTGAPSGYKIITQRNTLSHDGNSYHGTFTYSLYDDSNNLITTLSGTTEAQRIDFDHPFSL